MLMYTVMCWTKFGPKCTTLYCVSACICISKHLLLQHIAVRCRQNNKHQVGICCKDKKKVVCQIKKQVVKK